MCVNLKSEAHDTLIEIYFLLKNACNTEAKTKQTLSIIEWLRAKVMQVQNLIFLFM